MVELKKESIVVFLLRFENDFTKRLCNMHETNSPRALSFSKMHKKDPFSLFSLLDLQFVDER